MCVCVYIYVYTYIYTHIYILIYFGIPHSHGKSPFRMRALGYICFSTTTGLRAILYEYVPAWKTFSTLYLVKEERKGNFFSFWITF